MKHIAIIFCFISTLFLLQGCASNHSANEPAYIHKLYQNIEQIKMWQDSLEENQNIIFRTISHAEEFRLQYDSEIVIRVTDDYFNKAWDIFSDISGYLLKARNYIGLFDDGAVNAIGGAEKFFYDTEKFLEDVGRWSEKIPEYNTAFLNLTTLMYKYDYAPKDTTH